MKHYLLLFSFVFSFGLSQAQTEVTLQNPSFEVNANGWEANGMSRVSNNYFQSKAGMYYMQTVVARGKTIADCSLTQVVRGLKEGHYQLSAVACHVQQDKLGSQVNVDDNPQTGAYIVAGNFQQEVSTAGTYTLDFSLIGETYVAIGAKSVKATGNFFAVDDFKLTYIGEASLDDYKASLSALIARAEEVSSAPVSLTIALSNAKSALTDESSTAESLRTAWSNLNTALNAVKVGSLIVNPSFENGTNGWGVKNMATQSNSVFSRKQGTYYLESWVAIGQHLGDASVCQTLKNLPDGNYKLQANALHIQQNASQSTVNSGSAQKGAWLYAGLSKTAITAMKQYSLDFTVVDGEGDVEIGVKAEGATGNYLCIDNFKLIYTGEVTSSDYAKVVQQLVDEGQAYLDKGIQDSASEPLQAAMDAAKAALAGTGTDAEGNTVYDPSALASAKADLKAALEGAQKSREIYDKLQSRIDYAEKVLGWWDGDARKERFINLLKTQLATAKERMTDYTLTSSSLNSTINTLNSRIANVDKKIYASGSACGSDTQLQNDNNQWSYARSYQSKHWILFWEKGYGSEPPSTVQTVLNTADKIFEFYANDLGFITINAGTSKTDTYKMIIRLKYTDEWEATGSGIDNTIGLLTLSRWAYSSREGQTLAHEIGHCFQYQVHCDNGDQNGWMYEWANSANGNGFWEMCAQWQAYKFYPTYQFNNEWLTNTLNGLHKNPLCEELRYNNYFFQDYFCHKHGMKFIGRLWNESKRPEDPFQTYMRITMDESLSAAEKLEQFNQEIWDYSARMTTFDMDPIRTYGKNTIGKRAQTSLEKDSEGYWEPNASNCVESFGNNAIRLNVPSGGKTVYADLIGEAGKSGYIDYNSRYAGWKFGFVAYLRDGTRVYGDVKGATNSDPEGTISFDCPANCQYLWFVVSGAPTTYFSRGWNGTTVDDEQWPYRVKFYQTNVYGNANNNEYPVGIEDVMADGHSVVPADNVYSITGQLVRQGTTSTEGLPQGIYVIGGKKVLVR